MGKNSDIRTAVEDELAFDPLVDASGITVQAFSGDVELNGTVPSYPQYLQAAGAARRVAGVTGVHNHLQVVLPASDYRHDSALAAAASDVLALNVAVPGNVEATARDGTITLTGTVTYGSQREAAEAAVGWLTGVRSVVDNIDISYDADPVDVMVPVQDALDRQALIGDDTDVVVDTHQNTVKLTGHVRTWAEHDAMIGAAWMSPGVYDVRDELLVTG